MDWSFFSNILFIVPITTVITGQILKQIVFIIDGEKLSWKTALTDGGLPSSHSGIMASLATTIYFVDGFSALFYLAFFMTTIVAKDAFGVRRESGKHAVLIKRMLKQLKLPDSEHIKMLVGHTKTQVISGIIWGVIVAVSMHFIL